MKRLLFLFSTFFYISPLFSQLSQNFDDAFPPPNWFMTTASAKWVQSSQTADFPSQSGHYAAFNSYNIEEGLTASLITPAMVISEEEHLFSFWANYYLVSPGWGQSAELYIDVYGEDDVLVVEGTTNLIIGQHDLGWLQKVIDLSDYEGYDFKGEVVKIGFRAVSDYGSYNIAIDAVEGPVCFLPTCPAPISLIATDVTVTSAVLDWSEYITLGSWDLYIANADMPIPDSTTIPTIENITTKPYYWNGGVGNKDYVAYVRADCEENGKSEWSEPVYFSTLCGIAEMPYSENFEGYGYQNFPDCWSKTYIGESSNYYGLYISEGGHNSLNHLSLYSNKLSAQVFFISPRIFEGVANRTVDFWAESTLAGGKLMIGTMNDPNDVETCSYQDTILLDRSYSNYSVSFGSEDLSEFVFFSVASGDTARTIHLDDILIHDTPLCSVPTGVKRIETTITGATFTWEDDGMSDSWDLYIAPKSYNVELPLEPTVEGVTENTFTWSEGSENHAYMFYIRSNCTDTDKSEWVGPYYFRTRCVGQLPWTESFESYLPSWDYQYIEYYGCELFDGNWSYAGGSWTDDARTGDIYLRLESYDDREIFYTRGFELEAGQSYDFSFWSEATSGIYISVGTEQDRRDMVEIPVAYNAGEEWNYYSTTFTPEESGVYYFGVSVSFYSYSLPEYFDFDDFSLKKTSDCPLPSEQHISNLRPHQVELNWEGNGATEWEIKWGDRGGHIDTASLISGINTNTYTLTGLEENTEYSWYVRARCGADSSNWNGPYLCQTEVIPNKIIDFPYSESFEFSIGSWTQMNDDVGDWSRKHNTLQQYAVSDGYGYLLGGGGLIVAFDFTNLSFPEMYFDYKMYGLDMGALKVEVSIDEGVSWTTVWSDADDHGRKWNLAIVDLADYSGVGNLYLRFWTTSGGWSSIAIDHVRVHEKQSCPPPTGLQIDDLTTSEAVFEWDSIGTAQNWDVFVGFVGDSISEPTDSQLTASAYNWTGGVENTDYEFRVRSVCADMDTSEWSLPLTFLTECSPIVPEYFQDFSDDISCWKIAVNGDSISGPAGYGYAGGWKINQGQSNHGCGPAASVSDKVENPSWLISPQFDFLGDDYELLIDIKQYCYAYLRGNGRKDSLSYEGDAYLQKELLSIEEVETDDSAKVQLYITTDAGLTWELLQTWQPIFGEYYWNDMGKNIIDVSAYSGIVQFAFLAKGGYENSFGISGVCIREFNVRHLSPCPVPSDLSASNENGTGAELTWMENGEAQAWDLYIVPKDSMSPVNSTMPTIAGVTENPFIWSGGDYATDYDFYVRSVCSDDAVSYWNGPVSFATTCKIFEPEYYEDFSTFLPKCWQRASGGTPTEPYQYAVFGSWGNGGFGGVGTTGSAVTKIQGNFSKKTWLISPDIDLGMGNWMFEFDAAITKVNDTIPSKFGQDDEMQFLISFDDGLSWSNLLTINVMNQPTNTGTHYSGTLNDYHGIAKFAFWLTSGNIMPEEELAFYVDNLRISPAMTSSVTFNVNMANEGSDEAYIAGEFNDWIPEAMVDNGDMTYSFSKQLLIGDTIEYRFLVDSTQWEDLTGESCALEGTPNRYVIVEQEAIDVPLVCFDEVNDCVLGFQEEKMQSDFKIYPNPAKNEVKIAYKMSKISDLNITIVNGLGQFVKQKKKVGVREGTIVLDISTLVPGVYYVRISNDGVHSMNRILFKM